MDIDFEDVEEQLDVTVPNIYRMFVEAAASKQVDLREHGLYFSTESIVRGNLDARLALGDGAPRWKDEYFDFGVGDGCGNVFFLDGTDDDCATVRLLSHDPVGIEDVGPATDFFRSLLSELEAGFTGPDALLYQGNLSAGERG